MAKKKKNKREKKKPAGRYEFKLDNVRVVDRHQVDFSGKKPSEYIFDKENHWKD